MSNHAAFRRVPVEQQFAQNLRTINIPVPTRGIIRSENEAFMKPGGAIVQDNWMPTMRGVKLRGGSKRWCVLPETTPVISAFEYVFGTNHRMFAGNATKLYDVTAQGGPVAVKTGQTSGNYAAAQITSTSGLSWLTVVNDTGDFPLQFDGTTWVTLSASEINGPAGSPVAAGRNLTYIWKYRGRYFFIEASSMNAWYLGTDSHRGTLLKIPLSGAASKGGRLLFGCTWSLDAGDGIDDKCVFVTDLGEVIIFTGSNPGDVNNWRQEGRYQIPPPLGMNAHVQVGGDVLIATTEGIVPLSQSITKDAAQLDLAALTYNIKPLWRDEVAAKRGWSWSMEKWDEYGGLFVTTPGGPPGNRYCYAANNQTTAWCRYKGWDATCFIRLRGDMFFGTQDGKILQADRTGFDDAQDTVVGGVPTIVGDPYTCTLVGGWELLQSQGAQGTWHQARASFSSPSGAEPFVPQLDATTDYEVIIPPPPSPGQDLGVADVWDQGLWDVAKYDQPSISQAPIRNTLWVSIGKSGFSHAPIVQVQIAQRVPPNVELIALAATFERGGVNV